VEDWNSGKLEYWMSGMVEEWNTGMLALARINPIFHRSSIPFFEE
jgi:hypothetical protein